MLEKTEMVEILVNDKLLHLRNDHVSYIIYILEGGIPAHLYFGKRVEGLNPASILRRYDLPTDGRFSLQGCALDHTPHEYPAHPYCCNSCIKTSYKCKSGNTIL